MISAFVGMASTEPNFVQGSARAAEAKLNRRPHIVPNGIIGGQGSRKRIPPGGVVHKLDLESR